jgi:hypothetical protein
VAYLNHHINARDRVTYKKTREPCQDTSIKKKCETHVAYNKTRESSEDTSIWLVWFNKKVLLGVFIYCSKEEEESLIYFSYTF